MNSIAKISSTQNGLKTSFRQIPEEPGIIRFRFRCRDSSLSMPYLEFSIEPGNEKFCFKFNHDKSSLNCNSIGTYAFNGISNRDFTWPENLLNYSEFLAAKQYIPLEKRFFTVDLIHWNNEWRLSLDGKLLKIFPSMRAFSIKRSTDEIEVTNPEIIPLGKQNELFEPVELSFCLNEAKINNEKIVTASLPPANSISIVENIPFFFPERVEKDHIDLGMSWIREGALFGIQSGDRGPFGGRWAGALSNNLTRIQFRIPNRQYNSIYLIATADNDADSIPVLSVQFYKPSAGFPKTFVCDSVPAFTAKSSFTKRLNVQTDNGKTRSLWLIRIPVDSAVLAEFSKQDFLELELTKRTRLYRSFPDPAYYSRHGAGLPSSVHVFAMTLETRPVTVGFEPEQYANIFMENEDVAYFVTLKNNSIREEKIELKLSAESFDGRKSTVNNHSLTLAAKEEKKVRMVLPLRLYGWHSVQLDVNNVSFKRTLVRLRVRENVSASRPFDDAGHIFGFWPSGGHYTPSADLGALVMGKAGAKAYVGSIKPSTDRLKKVVPEKIVVKKETDDALYNVMQKYGMKNYTFFGFIDFRYLGFDFPRPEFPVTFNLSEPDRMRKELLVKLRELEQKPSAVCEPKIVRIFGEPGGIGTSGVPGEYSGEENRPLTKSEAERFELYQNKLKLSARLVRKHYPNAKILMPHGDPIFTVPFLKIPELAALIDGVALDYGYFDRIPEQQMHQCSLHRTWVLMDAWKKYKKSSGVFATFEGPCLGPVTPGSLNVRESAAHLLRCALLLSGFGVSRQYTPSGPFEPESWYGEQHYAGALIARGLNPYPSYAVYGAMTRHLGDKIFAKLMSAPSLSTFCYQYRHITTRSPMYVLWVIRGTRKVAFDKQVLMFDAMDNEFVFKPGEKMTVSDMPVFIYGAGENVLMKWDKADNSDSIPGRYTSKLSNLSDSIWQQVQEDEPLYTQSNPAFIRRFPAQMKTEPLEGALALTLEKQSVDRGVMPYYTSFKPKKPIVIPGKGAYLDLMVRGTSDWGRVVYVLRDVAGQKWISVGMKDAYNCDDTQGRSVFSFDGWRLVRFELPAYSPYDQYRENGTTWWGTSNEGNTVVLPLFIEKIIIERRLKAMYGNVPVDCSKEPVLLGDLSVEYETSEAKMANAERLSRLSIAVPQGGPRLNPIQILAENATLPPSKIFSVEHPSTEYDGTRGIFRFQLMPDAVYYDIYLSRSIDGTNAIKLGSRLKGSDSLVKGFLAGKTFYAFVVYYNRVGGHSTPSPAFEFQLDDQFAMK